MSLLCQGDQPAAKVYAMRLDDDGLPAGPSDHVFCEKTIGAADVEKSAMPSDGFHEWRALRNPAFRAAGETGLLPGVVGLEICGFQTTNLGAELRWR